MDKTISEKAKLHILENDIPKALIDLETILYDNPRAFIKIYLCIHCSTIITAITTPNKHNHPERCKECR